MSRDSMFITKAMRNQLTTCGIPIKVKLHLRPTKSTMKLYNTAPNIPPMQNNELIQLDSYNETGPVSKGDSLDNRIGTFGDAQPSPMP